MNSKKNYIEIWENFRVKGEEKSLAIIYNDFFDRLFDFGLRYTSDYSLIEDSIQNLFGYLFDKRSSLKSISNLSFFLLNSFRHELFLQIRKRDKVSFSDSKHEDKNLFCYNLVEDRMNQEVRDHFSSVIREHVKKLGTRQQEIIFLRFHQELNYTEIAEMLNISVDSCYKSVHRSIKIIKDELEKVLPNAKQLILYFSLLFKEKILI